MRIWAVYLQEIKLLSKIPSKITPEIPPRTFQAQISRKILNLQKFIQRVFDLWTSFEMFFQDIFNNTTITSCFSIGYLQKFIKKFLRWFFRGFGLLRIGLRVNIPWMASPDYKISRTQYPFHYNCGDAEVISVNDNNGCLTTVSSLQRLPKTWPALLLVLNIKLSICTHW